MSDLNDSKKRKGKRLKVPDVFLSSAVVRPTDDVEQQPLRGSITGTKKTQEALQKTDLLVKQAEKIQKKSEQTQRDIESLINLDEEEDDRPSFSLVPDSFLSTALHVTDPKPRATVGLGDKLETPKRSSPPKKKDVPLGTDRKGNLALPLLRELESMTSQRKHDTFATFYEADGKPTEKLTFGDAWNRSGVVSYHLRVTWKLQKGQTVALVLDYGLNYVYTWLGCLRAGVVPLIVASPMPPNYEQGLTKLNSMLHSAAPIALILTDSVVKYWKEEDENDHNSATRKMWPDFCKWKAVDKLPKPKQPKQHTMDASFSSVMSNLSFSSLTGGSKQGSPSKEEEEEEPPQQRESLFERLSSMVGGGRKNKGSNASLFGKKRNSDESNQGIPRPSFRESLFGVNEKEPLMAGTAYDEESLQPNDVACLQATSGSTAEPKIVMVTFQALFESLKMTQRSLSSIFDAHETLMGLSWVPPDHHIGLFLSMLCPLLSGCSMHYMSRFGYEESPKQWLELLSKYKIAWTVAPDNGYRMIMREFSKTLNSSVTIMANLDLSNLKILLNIGESPKFNTPAKLRKCFVPYCMPRDCLILTGYGLAEHVMPISWLEQKVFAVPSVAGFAMTKRVAVASKADLEQENIAVLVVDPKTKTPAKKTQMGEIWVWSPFLPYLPGYFNDKKLSKKIFRARFKGSSTTYLRTGDIGVFDGDNLYVCCRKEDVLTTPQGIKFAPPDIEWFAEDAKPQIKPGCVAAFASVAGTVEIALEVYEGTKPNFTRNVCQSLAQQIPKFTRMEVSSCVAVPHMTLPRTPIGTVQRRHTKLSLLKDEMPIVFDFPKREERITMDKPGKRDSINSIGDEDSDWSEEGADGDAKSAATKRPPNTDKIEIVTVTRIESKTGLASEKATGKEDPELKKDPDASESKDSSMRRSDADSQEQPKSSGSSLDPPVPRWKEKLLKKVASTEKSSAAAEAANIPSPTVPAWKQKLQKRSATKEDDVPGSSETKADSLTSASSVPAWKQKLLKRTATKEEPGTASEAKADSSNPPSEDASGSAVPKWKQKLLEKKLPDARGKTGASAPSEAEAHVESDAVPGEEGRAGAEAANIAPKVASAPSDEKTESTSGLGMQTDGEPGIGSDTSKAASRVAAHAESVDASHAAGSLPPSVAGYGNSEVSAATIDAVEAPDEAAFSSNSGTDSSLAPADAESGPGAPSVTTAESRLLAQQDPIEPGSPLKHASDTAEHFGPPISESLTDEATDAPLQEEGMASATTDPLVQDPLFVTLSPLAETKDPTDDEVDKILSRYLGPSFDNELSWEEAGLTSTASVPLRTDIENAFHLTLPPDFQGRFPTPTSLKEHISDTECSALKTEKPQLKVKKSRELSWCTTGILQALLMVVMFVLFSAPLIPCWLVFEHLQAHEIFCLLLVPIYTTTYSVIVIMAKWMVVGRYEECRMLTPSFAYLSWWFVDRLISVWECWVGQFIIDTPLIWLFYVLMGARLSASCQLAGFIREFDLVSIGANASLKYPCLKCRKFQEWSSHESGPTMVFRSITLSEQCTVRGMLSPGVLVEEGAYVEKLCVVPEGAIVDEEVTVAGNPAYVSDEAERREYPCWRIVGLFKVFWIFGELALLYGIWEGALYFNPTPEGVDADGAPVDYVYWIIFAVSCVMLSLLSSIVIKFLLVGQRSPGKQGFCGCYWTDWAADYHFNLVTLPFRFFAGNSRLCNVVLILHGMSIDFASKVEMESFPPSKMDLISVRRSFLGKNTFDVKHDRIFYRTIIEDSSVGHRSHFQSDILLVKTLIRPFTLVSESVVYRKLDPDRAMGHSCLLYLKEIIAFILDIVLLAKTAMTIFVAYLVWHFLFDYVSFETCVPILAASLAAQGLAWNLLFIIIAHVRFLGISQTRAQPLFPAIHWVYLSMGHSFQQWSFLKLTYGSPIFNFLMKCARMSFEGRALYYGERIYDSPLIKLGDRTVVDGATLVGHNNVYDHFTFDRTYVRGTVGDKSLILPNGNRLETPTTGIGPWLAVVPTCDPEALTRRSSGAVALLRSMDDIEAAFG